MSEPTPKRTRLSLPVVLAHGPDLQTDTAAAPADVIGYFAQRGQRAKHLEQQTAGLIEANSTLQTTVKAAQAELAAWKEKARLQAQSVEATETLYQKEKTAAEAAYQREMGRTADALSQLKQAERDKFDALDQRESTEAKMMDMRGRFKQEQLSLTAKLKRLESELRTVKQDADLARRMHGPRASPPDTKQSEYLRELQHSLREVTATAEEESRLRRQLEISLAEQQQHAQAVEAELRRARKAEDGSHDDVIRALRSELRSQGAEIAQARKIQSRVKSLGVMQEKLQAAEARAARAENEQAASLELQSRISTLEMQLQAWEASANDLGIDRPEELFAKLQELRNECLAAANSRGDTEVELRKSQEELKAARNSTVELQATLHSVQGANAELAALAARFERKVSLLTREREGLQKMLASYSAEEAMPTNNAENGQQPTPAMQSAQIENLEGQVKELCRQVEMLEDSISQSANLAKRLQEELADTMAKAQNAKSERDRVQAEADHLNAEVAQLQGRLDKGEFNSSATRVLHYVLNPEAEARREQQQACIAELKSEVALLKTQLQHEWDKGPQGSTGEGLPSAGVAALEAEITVLNQKVADITQREVRLKDVFQQQVANFREAVYCLFGYRVDMAAEATSAASSRAAPTTFILRPQHADSSHMQLMFQFKGKRMELLPTDYTTRKLKREVETFIVRFKSIPAFTANLTIELFQKQTQC